MAKEKMPYNENVEKAVLGSCFLSNDALLNVIGSLQEEDFYLPKHKLIFLAIKSLNEKNVTVDVIAVTQELLNLKQIDEIGGVAYLKECSDSMVALSSLDYYIKILIDQSVLRKLLNASKEIYDDYFSNEIEDINSYILSSQELINKAVERRRISSFKSVKDISRVVKEEFDTVKAKEGTDEDEIIGVTTGFPRLNYLTSGFKKSELVIIAARPSVGKTTLAMNFAYNAATQGKVSVAIFSLEMSAEQLFKKLVSAASGVDYHKIETCRVFGRERNKVAEAIEEVSNANIYIDATPGLNLIDIIAKSKKLQASDPRLGMIVIDYLGLINYTNKNGRFNNDGRAEEVRKISAALKQLARDLNIPVLVLSQLNRSVEQRDNKRPMLSDLRDSGSIEQDADIVMLLYRADYYKSQQKVPLGDKKTSQLSESDKYELASRQKAQEIGKETPGNASYVEVEIAKNRSGQTGKVGLIFLKSYAKFESPTKEMQESMEEFSKFSNGGD